MIGVEIFIHECIICTLFNCFVLKYEAGSFINFTFITKIRDYDVILYRILLFSTKTHRNSTQLKRKKQQKEKPW